MLRIDEYDKSNKTYQLGDKLESIVDLTNVYRLERFFNPIYILIPILRQYTNNVYIFVMCRNGT